MEKEAKIYIAGHTGLVGSAIVRRLKNDGFTNLLIVSHKDCDLRIQNQVSELFKQERPEYIFLVAAKVGGIHANITYPAEFIYDNLQIQTNVIHSSWKTGVKKLIFLNSSCIYPKFSPQPMLEEYLLTGLMEPTNEMFGIAKIAGIKMCQAYRRQYNCNFISAIASNLYGPNDNYNLKNSHVLGALIRKFHEAKINKLDRVILWGDGSPRREFLYIDDLVDALLFLMDNYNEEEPINIGTGVDITVKELAQIVKSEVGYQGEIYWDVNKPNGIPRKLLDISKLSNLGGKYKIRLKDGIHTTYKYFVEWDYPSILKKESNGYKVNRKIL